MRALIYSEFANFAYITGMSNFVKINKTHLLPRDDSFFEIPEGYNLILEFHDFGYNMYSHSRSGRRCGVYRDTNISLVLLGEGKYEDAIVGFDIKRDTLHIEQLQSMLDAKDYLPRKWERMLLESAINFARDLRLSQVQVQKAEHNKWYKKNSEENFRNRLKMRYDITAKRRGFTLDDKLDVWVLNLNT